MAELIGKNLTAHLDAIFSEFEHSRSIYGYPERRFFLGYPDYDFSVDFHDRKAATPLGPASGPHTQMAQNIVLSFLGGGRIMELKTVQILDRLQIPRQCIDIRNIGYNVEWSQELLLADSYSEYVTAWILIAIIRETEMLGIAKTDSFYDTIFDISAGYDLEGISSPAIQHWLKDIKDAEHTISGMLADLPERYAKFRDLKIDTEISDSVTLSTFHGCPRHEIEAILQHLISEHNFHAIVKLNPTILGYETVARILHDDLGYHNIELNKEAFDSDLQFDEMVAMMQRLQQYAAEHDRNIGAKFTNTLVVKNNEDVFEDETMYLSGPPLHVLAMHAVRRFREALGDKKHVSFSAGIDKHNFADTVACNIKPVSVCTDLLKTGGYTRMFDYMRNLHRAMEESGSTTISQFILARAGANGESDIHQAGRLSTESVTDRLIGNPRYHYRNNQKTPPKIDSQLRLFDCITCNKCLPVCPNAANFSLATGSHDRIKTDYQLDNGHFTPVSAGRFVIEKQNQIANLADFCNECGDCDTYCPEYGGPFIEKPRFFFSKESYDACNSYDGFYLVTADAMTGRIGGVEYSLSLQKETDDWHFRSPLAEMILSANEQLISAKASATANSGAYIDMKAFYIMKTLLNGIRASQHNYATMLLCNPKETI